MKVVTSITLPVGSISFLKAEMKKAGFYQTLLRRLNKRILNRRMAIRHRTRDYNPHRDEEFKKQTVVWDIELYNRLHLLADHKRISVSYLFFILLHSTDVAIESPRNFGTYVHKTDNPSRYQLIFTQNIKFNTS